MQQYQKLNFPSAGLYRLLACGMVLALLVLISGFVLNIIAAEDSGNYISREKDFTENPLTLGTLYEILKNPLENKVPLIGYSGLFILIMTPVAGLFYTLVFYIKKRNTIIISIIIAIILILASSAAVGFIR